MARMPMPTLAKTAATVFNCIFMPLAIIGNLIGNEKSGLEPTENRVGCIRCAHARFIRSRFLFLRLLASYTNHL